jgi:hypothetical protein
MRSALILPILTLTALTAAPSCGPAEAGHPQTTSATVPAQPEARQEPATLAPEQAAEIPASPVAIAATSRGPDLEASDPGTFSLASGQVQLVEFFRYT